MLDIKKRVKGTQNNLSPLYNFILHDLKSINHANSLNESFDFIFCNKNQYYIEQRPFECGNFKYLTSFSSSSKKRRNITRFKRIMIARGEKYFLFHVHTVLSIKFTIIKNSFCFFAEES